MTIHEIITTPQAAERLNTTHYNLLQLLHRYPHLRPMTRVGLDFVWTETELEQVAAHRGRRRRRKMK